MSRESFTFSITLRSDAQSSENIGMNSVNDLQRSVLCFSGFVVAGLNSETQQRLIWYILFVLYAPYVMLPLPTRWCVLAGFGTASMHFLLACLSILNDQRHHEVSSNFKSFYVLASIFWKKVYSETQLQFGSQIFSKSSKIY